MKVYFALLIVLVVGCAKGTGTGNPYSDSTPASGTTPLPVPANSVSGDVFINVCMNIQRCHPEVTADVCDSAIENMTTFGAKLGLGLTSTTTVAIIIAGEADGSLAANMNPGLACVSALSALSCSDPSMAAAYDSTSVTPFVNAPNILDPVCEQVFGP